MRRWLQGWVHCLKGHIWHRSPGKAQTVAARPSGMMLSPDSRGQGNISPCRRR